jgi:hypothetical protein
MASINFFYQQYAIQFMSLNLDESGLFIMIPSEKDDNKFYRVDLVEETMQAAKCECFGFRRWQKCKHETIVNSAFAGYKPVAPASVEPKITEVEAGEWYIVNADTQVWMNEGQWLSAGPTESAVEIVKAHVEGKQAVAEAERIVSPERKQVWNSDLCCAIYADTREIVDPAAHEAKLKLQREAYEAEQQYREGKVFDSILQEWVTPPSDEPIDHFASLAGTRVGKRKAQEQDKAQKLNEISVIKGNLNGAQQSAVLLMELPSRRTA